MKRLTLLRCVLIAFGLAPILANPAAFAADKAAPAQAALPAVKPAADVYRLAPGDRINVAVFGYPDFTSQPTIDQSGQVRLPIIGEIHAASLTVDELERRVAHELANGYVNHPVVTVTITEYRPIYVLGLVRRPGVFPYRQGLSVLSAIAAAGGIGTAESVRGTLSADVLQAEERVHQLEIQRATTRIRRARLNAQLNGKQTVDFPDLSESSLDPVQFAQLIENEKRAFQSERDAEKQEADSLQSQIPSLRAEIASLKDQQKLEQQQRDLNHQLVASYEKMMGNGLIRKPNYIEVKREEARIDENIERLRSSVLRADQAIGDTQFRIEQLHDTYRRRVITELQQTDQTLLGLSVSLPAAQRLRAERMRQLGLLTANEAAEPSVTVVRASGKTVVKLAAAGAFKIEPGDVVEVGPLTAPTLATASAAEPANQLAAPGIPVARGGKHDND
ncbi:MAG TPA: polysaccharide biosynthesis/export family protein [Pseudolabrys sp.]|nr:polysaccharide biosynthesis/export family protein [Pseudolabrys sp.]